MFHNNKGKVVEQYEPYFDSGYDYSLPLQQGQKIKLFYDALDRPTQTLNPDGTAQLSVYGIPLTLSSPTQQSSGRFTTDYRPTAWESYAYDANDLGGDTHPTESSSYSSHWNTPESREIDALDRTIKTTQRLDSTPANDIIMQYEYDLQGRLTKVTDPLNRDNFIYKYPTVRLSARLPDGQGAEADSEAAPPEAEALKITHLDSGSKTQIFDARGQLIEMQDAKNNRFYTASDYQAKPLKVWMQESGQAIRLGEQYTYGELGDIANNQFGKLKSLLDEAGEEQYLAYDFKGNLLHKQRKVIKDALLSNAEKFAIDWAQGLPDDHLNSRLFESNTKYDALNRVEKITLPEDTELERKEIIPHYNRAGALEKVELDGNEYLKEIAYNAKGQRILISFGNGVMNRYTYDAQNFRLLRMKAEKYTFSETASERTYAYNSGTNRQDLGYEYDLNGNILKKKNRTPDSGISGTTLGVDAIDNEYAYDAISRLLTATGRESEANNESHRWADATVAGSPNAGNTQVYARTYTYDKVGNIQSLQQSGTNAFTREFEYTDNSLENITVSGSPTPFTYDANGNLLTSGSSRFYDWNSKDQLTFFKIQAGGTPSVYAHYLYDAGGNRLKKIVWDQQGNKEVTVYIDGVFEYRLKQEDGDDKEQNIVHLLDDTSRIAQKRIGNAFNDDISEAVHYIIDDHLGSSNARLDDSGSIIDRQEFYPFGDTSLRTYTYKRYQYIGREKDAESGLHYWSARYYSSWMCRFISVDKLASSYAHLTPYNYADNDPINDFDIDGNQNNNTEQRPSGGGSDSMVVPATEDGTPMVNIPEVNITATDGAWDAKALEIINLGGPIARGLQKRIENGERGFALTGIKFGEGLSGDEKKKHEEFMAGMGALMVPLYGAMAVPLISFLPAPSIATIKATGTDVAIDITTEAALGVDLPISPLDFAKLGGRKAGRKLIETKVDDVSKANTKLLNPPININEKSLAHTLDRHTFNGNPKWANKSKFFNASEVESLIHQGTQMPMIRQSKGNFSRIVNAGRNIGVDRTTGNPTSIYTIITNEQGNLITAFPGIP